jgi:hypothetical protein
MVTVDQEEIERILSFALFRLDLVTHVTYFGQLECLQERLGGIDKTGGTAENLT